MRAREDVGEGASLRTSSYVERRTSAAKPRSDDPTRTSIPDSGSIGFDVARRRMVTSGAPSIAASG